MVDQDRKTMYSQAIKMKKEKEEKV